MHVLICGSRDFTNYEYMEEALTVLGDAPLVVIEGCARGADQLAERWAASHGILNKHFPPDRTRYGSSAEVKRNQQMLDEGKPDIVVAFPLDTSKGTWDMINRAKKAGVKVLVWYYEVK